MRRLRSNKTNQRELNAETIAFAMEEWGGVLDLGAAIELTKNGQGVINESSRGYGTIKVGG